MIEPPSDLVHPSSGVPISVMQSHAVRAGFAPGLQLRAYAADCICCITVCWVVVLVLLRSIFIIHLFPKVPGLNTPFLYNTLVHIVPFNLNTTPT